ncbi:MAG: hypothetical protein KC432_05855 [Thermomicrobiales bacterium]|nr:hypothetical protein [Thermomicrobiales bacterium]
MDAASDVRDFVPAVPADAGALASSAPLWSTRLRHVAQAQVLVPAPVSGRTAWLAAAAWVRGAVS